MDFVTQTVKVPVVPGHVIALTTSLHGLRLSQCAAINSVYNYTGPLPVPSGEAWGPTQPLVTSGAYIYRRNDYLFLDHPRDLMNDRIRSPSSTLAEKLLVSIVLCLRGLLPGAAQLCGRACARDSDHPHHHSAVDGNPKDDSTCLRGTAFGDFSSLLCNVLLTGVFILLK